MKLKKVIIGKPKVNKETGKFFPPKRKFRINVQQRKTKTNQVEKMSSFMVYVYSNKKIESLIKEIHSKIN